MADDYSRPGVQSDVVPIRSADSLAGRLIESVRQAAPATQEQLASLAAAHEASQYAAGDLVDAESERDAAWSNLVRQFSGGALWGVGIAGVVLLIRSFSKRRGAE
jgi:hypothetical protein